MGVPIVYVITGLATGGSETALESLLARLDRDRFQPTVVCLKSGNTRIGDEIRSLNVPVIDLDLVSPARVGALWRLYTLLVEQRPFIIHAWLFHAVVAARLLGRMTGVPIIISARRNINLGSPFRETVNRMTIGADERVIALSEAARRVEIERGGAAPDKITVIYNGIDIGLYPPVTPRMRADARSRLALPPAAALIGTVARLHPSKGVDDFVRAAARVLVRLPGARFVVVGDGGERTALDRLADELGIADKVHFVGERSDVRLLLAGLDLFVLASREEGLGTALLEAMAAGVPVVATSVGGIVEVVEHSVSGILAPPGDVDRLADSIVTMLDDRELADRLSKNGRQRIAEKFSIETTVEKTQRLYDELLEARLGKQWMSRRVPEER
jgi:glycosyltransferase involved in cell wall biosynthesis